MIHKCKYCGTTEDLFVTKVGNSKNNMRESVTNICRTCKSKLMKKAATTLGSRKYSTKEQLLFNIVRSIYSDATTGSSLVVDSGRALNPDILVESMKLVIEYDGSYFHTQEHDNERDKRLVKAGYRVMHYVNCLPSKQTLLKDIQHIFSNNGSVLYRENSTVKIDFLS
jgi:hypothetical protein